jgi:hypothetical protein
VGTKVVEYLIMGAVGAYGLFALVSGWRLRRQSANPTNPGATHSAGSGGGYESHSSGHDQTTHDWGGHDGGGHDAGSGADGGGGSGGDGGGGGGD